MIGKRNHRQGLEGASVAIASDGGIQIAVDLVDVLMTHLIISCAILLDQAGVHAHQPVLKRPINNAEQLVRILRRVTSRTMRDRINFLRGNLFELTKVN